ncbi:hypothetical protein J1N35_013480 [Gossypium stocksii]|uniref:Uncharacterized protein n=1 Tax=Gossypium stocksii TaxID=47602 RepID=A0A9D4A8E8_9ROSI|nr:hypothetical protein J1N35_013480 [Gossypium stocksii]
MGYKRSLIVERRGGLSGLHIIKDVATRSRSGHRLNVIVLEWNKGRLGVNRRWWILSKSNLSSFTYHKVVSRELCTYQCEKVGLHKRQLKHG